MHLTACSLIVQSRRGSLQLNMVVETFYMLFPLLTYSNLSFQKRIHYNFSLHTNNMPQMLNKITYVKPQNYCHLQNGKKKKKFNLIELFLLLWCTWLYPIFGMDATAEVTTSQRRHRMEVLKKKAKKVPKKKKKISKILIV